MDRDSSACGPRDLGLRGNVLGFGALGFKGLGFQGLGLRVLGFRA